MKLQKLLQAYDFDELMPEINDMFPGTTKYREQLKTAYDILTNMHAVESKKSIRYKIIDGEHNEKYMGAEDAGFECNWEVALGKDVSRERGVDLTDAQICANCLVNLCVLGKYPKEFEKAHRILTTPER